MSDIRGSDQRDPALDGLRGVAALAVALGHSLLQIGGLKLWGSSLHDFHSMGRTDIILRLLSAVAPSDAAVTVFFVLSGHVLWSSFQRKGFRFFNDLPDYACARVYRLLPVAIVTALPLGFLTTAAARELVMNMLLLRSSLNGVLWSLQVEMVASLGLFALWGLTTGVRWKLLLGLVLACGVTIMFRGNPYAVFFPAFVLGALISSMPRRLLRNRWVLVAGVAVLVLTNVVIGHTGPTRCFEMAGATLVVGAVVNGQLQFLRSSVPLFLGTISYPFYLTHWLGLAGAGPVVALLGLGSPFSRLILLAVLSIGLTIPMAWLLHVGVENPALRGRPRIRWRWRRADARNKLKADGSDAVISAVHSARPRTNHRLSGE
jgi:peptidoglycan/LPS O-acetylase OafA/YrhL